MNRTEAKKAWNSLKSRANRQYKKGILRARFNWDSDDFVAWYTEADNECFYCHIPGGKFIPIWGEFYGGRRGKRLEVDRKNNAEGYSRNNCVKACSLCNCAKSDKIEFCDFKRVGKIIEEIWKKTAALKRINL
ncbi:MAG: hypothetical protein HY954_01995 [Deltaproteobacteria bacterium]|nr:hypothetical protein [Deltaproteobacteria bacterium]